MIANFRGFLGAPEAPERLKRISQQPNEALSEYYRRFLRLKSQCPKVPEELMTEYTIQRLRASPLSSKFTKKHPLTLQDMCSKFEEYCMSKTYYKRIENLEAKATLRAAEQQLQR